ncbi:DsbA family protein [Pleomorphomonas sp. PLEO]|uniref:DsbA family protein n=1 Tax=Pleomorphomonas sp. PLEO TaxID=3239306 RepID=UPI00351E3754
MFAHCRKFLMATLVAATLLPSTAYAEDFTASQKAAIGDVVKAYLMDHPEVIADALQALDARNKMAEEQGRTDAIQANREAIFSSPYQAVLGDPNAKIALVEFFDYNCGYCKKALSDTRAILDKEKDVKIILKEFPILSEGSVEAAKVAAAVNILDPKAYEAFHFDLLGSRGQADGDRALAAAAKAGLDEAKVKETAAKPEVAAAISQSYDLAHKLNINGTPAYIIGDELVYGAVGFSELNSKIEAMRACGKTTC